MEGKGWLKISLVVATALSMAQASAYKLPEQSVRSLGLSAAYVAGTKGADTSYYNPANMGWMDEKQYLDGALTLIYLPKVAFEGRVGGINADGKSKNEDFLVPMLHYVGPKFGRWRFGFSLTAPGGLSKRWDKQPQRTYAEEFTLAIVEANPTFSYTVNDRWSIGGGLRVVYSDGRIKAYGEDARGGFLFAENLKGDSFDFGYNLALSYRPSGQTTLSLTYRSNVDLTVKGRANGGGPAVGKAWFDTDADVQVPLPATLALAAHHRYGDLEAEVVYERTFWSKYDKLDFNFADTTIERSLLGRAKSKDWSDTNTLRLGATWHVDSRWDMLFGYAWDETPIPEKSLGFELPDADAQIFSVGTTYKIKDDLEVGFALLYDKKSTRSVATPPNENGIDGTFSEGGAYLMSVGVGYRF